MWNHKSLLCTYLPVCIHSVKSFDHFDHCWMKPQHSTTSLLHNIHSLVSWIMSIKFFNLCSLRDRKFVRLSRCRKLILLITVIFVFFIIISSFVDPRDSDVKDHTVNQVKSFDRKKAGILCYILLSPRKISAAQTIKETWGSKCDKLIFYGRFNNTQLPVTFIQSKEGYKFLWGKTQAALIHLQQNYHHLYDWFLKADDDTFIVLENLRTFASNLNPTVPVWFGYKLKHPKAPQGYMSGGAAYVFSKAALKNVTNILSKKPSTSITPKCKADSIYGIEDLEIGNCFAAAKVHDISTTDERGRERFLPLPIEMLWEGKVPKYHWIWRQAWNPLQIGHNCCSSQVISTHQIHPGKMKSIFKAIYAIKHQNTTKMFKNICTNKRKQISTLVMLLLK